MLCVYRNAFSVNTFRAARFALSTSSTFRPLSMTISSNVPLCQPQFLQKVSVQPLQSPLLNQCQWRSYVAKGDLTQDRVSERVMTVIKLFEKINAEKLTMDSHFMKELGLDSLDHVELLMAVEDEFGFEIPDQDAEKLVKPSDIVKYLCQKLEVIH